MRLRTIVVAVAAVLAAAVTTVVVILLNIDINQYRGLITEKTREATGRTLTIKGELKLVLGLSPALAVNDVTFANASWGSRPNMVEAKRLEVQVALLPLLRGTIHVNKLVILESDILLETDAQGRGNWEFQPAAATQAAPVPSGPQPVQSAGGGFRLPQFDAVNIEGALLVFNDGELRKTRRFSLGHLNLKSKDDYSPQGVDINGTYNAFYFEIKGEVGSTAVLSVPGTKFPIDVTATLGATPSKVRVQGHMTDPLVGAGYDLKITAETNEIAQIGDFLRDADFAQLALPKLGPLSASLRLIEAVPSGKPSIREIAVEAGRPDLARLRATGAVGDLVGRKGIAVDVTLDGTETAAFSGFTAPGMDKPLPPIPALGPFKVEAKIANGPGDRLSLPALKAEIGSEDLLRVTLDGAVRDPEQRRGIALNLGAEAKDLGAVAKHLGLGMTLEGSLSSLIFIMDSGIDRYSVTAKKIEAAGSDLAGEATVSLAGERPVLTASLNSALVDLGRLMPGTAQSPGSNAPVQRSAPSTTPARPNDGRVFPNDPLPFETLNSLDGELRYKADAIRTSRGATLRDVSVQATLRNGDLVVRPLGGTIGGGKITGDLTLASRTGALALKASAKEVDLGAVDKEIPGDDLVSGGKTDIELDFRGRGTTVREIMAGLDGTMFLSIGSGTFTSRYADMLGLGDLMQVISNSLPSVERTQLNCVVGRLDIAKGQATTKVLLADTARLTLDGSGSINLASEQIGLRFNTSTKVVSLLSLLPPIRVHGTLADPSYTPDLGAGAVDGVGNILGGVLRTPGNIFGALTGQRRPANELCAGALAVAGGQAAPAAPANQNQAPAQRTTPTLPAQPAPSDPVQDLGRGIERNLRNLFGR